MDKMLLIKEIIEIIKNIDVQDGKESDRSNIIDAETLLSEEYGLDSIGLIEVVVGIEEKFNFEFDDMELNLSNFETVSSIVELVTKKREVESQ